VNSPGGQVGERTAWPKGSNVVAADHPRAIQELVDKACWCASAASAPGRPEPGNRRVGADPAVRRPGPGRTGSDHAALGYHVGAVEDEVAVELNLTPTARWSPSSGFACANGEPLRDDQLSPVELAPPAEELETNGLYHRCGPRGAHRLARQAHRRRRPPSRGAASRRKAGAPLLTMNRTAFDDRARRSNTARTVSGRRATTSRRPSCR